jgi:YbgC/YbaW family acyl-CoA thioester hydrolase
MAYEFKTTRRVEFCETDMAGIVHFSNFFRYMESVECAFYRSLGYSVILPDANPPLGLPRVHASCDYRRPLRFEDVVEMHLLVREIRPRSVSYQIRFRRIEPGPSEEVAVGHVTAVCVTKLPTGKLSAVPIPEGLFRHLEAAPRECLAVPGQTI